MRWFGLFLLLFVLVFSASAGFDGDPVYEQVSETNGMSFFAVRPFYSSIVDPAGERWRKDYVWPLYTQKGFKDEIYGRLLFFGYSGDFNADDDRHRNWILPFWFSGVDAHGERYAALFPAGGTIHEFLGRDKIMFVLFPAYATSSINEVETKTVFWPIYSRSLGDKVDRLRVFPLYGRSRLAGEFEKKFVAWPLYNSVEYTNDRNPGGGFILFPVYGHLDTKLAQTYWFVPPFCKYMTSDTQWILHAPWPFIQMADGIMYKRIVWPLYGTKKLGTLTRTYLFWPVLWNEKTDYAYDVQHRRYALPFLAYQSNVVKKEYDDYKVGDVTSRYWKVWPLMSWERNGDISRFRTLELWPLRNTPGVERNWAPYWCLYRRMNTDGEIGHHLLWGLYRQTKSDQEFEWSLLKGLAGYKRAESGTQFRFLFMNFGNKGE